MKRIILNILLVISLFFTISIVHALENTTWQNDWNYSSNVSAKTITLSKYNGSEATYKIPSKAVINGEEYSVILGGSSVKSTSIKDLSLEEGVKLNSTSSMFSGATNLEKVDLRGADVSGATTMYYMFQGCTNLKEINMSGLDASKVTNLKYMFYNCTSLTKLDMSNMNLSSVTGNGSSSSMIYGMFYNASKIEEISFANTDMSKVTSFAYSNATRNSSSSPIYAMYNMKKVNFNNFNTSGLTTAQRMFTIDANNSGNRNVVEEIDLTGWKIGNVTTLNEAFKHCGENNEIVIKGLDTLDTSKVTDFGGTFQSCYNLKDLTGVENRNTSSATRMNSMFSEAKSITKLDLSSWDTSNVTTMGSIFSHCEALTDLNVSTWNTSKVTTMDGAFKSCTSLEVLNLKSWTSESIQNNAGSHMWEMLGPQNPNSEHPMTPLKEITFNDNFVFSTFQPLGLRSGYWHLKEGTSEYTSKKFTPARLYTAYNSGVTPGDGYTHDHTYVLTELDPATATYYAHGWGDNNVWEVHYPTDKFKGYCINLHRGAPSGYYDRTRVSNNSIIDEGFLDSDNYGYEPLGSTMEEALITLIYYGYGNNAGGIQEKYNLTDSEFLMITQQAIWDYTDRYNNISERDRSTKYGQAHYELVSKKFSDIPNNENLKLYLYESIDGKQNLLSISGLSDVAHAGVRVLKLTNATDGSLIPLPGAEFSIYNDDYEVVGTITSDEDGYATKYNTDSIYGLPEGIYTIRETKAPRGYRRANDSYYSFIVRSEDDNTIITVGKLNSNGEDTAMIFENVEDTSVEGGGLIIKILDQEDKPILSGATFEIIDENGTVIDEITTGRNGEYRTGNKDLLLNKNYKARLKNGPKGYISIVEEQSDILTENGKYKTLVFRFITKTCKVNIKAIKKYNNPLTGNDFKFELIDPTNKVITTTNDKSGNITFNMSYDASNLGFMTYTLKEVIGTNKDMSYDNHKEEIIVNIDDDGSNDLKCSVEYENNTPTFINKYNGAPIDPLKPEKIEPSPNTSDNIYLYVVILFISVTFIGGSILNNKLSKI